MPATDSTALPTLAALLAERCRPLDGQRAMSADEVTAHLAALPGWRAVDPDSPHAAIEKRFGFGDFHRTMAFVNAVAWIAHAEDHHPDLEVGYAHCTVRYRTHAVGGVSINDMICAAKIDALRP
ncbi:MAG: 4a-hydroxytetrahydrobiopterin dehydratase [Burkholderiales bacterium]|nr:4a-hydroxytetrahydrobiopterin dehydratase [Burkholderiales bacterium]